MDNILNTSEINENFAAVNTLINALKTTIQLNDIIKSKLLNEENYFSHQQMKIIYENVDLLDDNSLILNQAVQAIKTLLTEIKNLKELKMNETFSNLHENNFDSKNNVNNTYTKYFDLKNNNNFNTNYLDSEILNRYNTNNNNNNNNINNSNSNYFSSKSEDEIKILDGSIKTNFSNNLNNHKIQAERNLYENAMKLNYDYTQINNNDFDLYNRYNNNMDNNDGEKEYLKEINKEENQKKILENSYENIYGRNAEAVHYKKNDFYEDNKNNSNEKVIKERKSINNYNHYENNVNQESNFNRNNNSNKFENEIKVNQSKLNFHYIFIIIQSFYFFKIIIKNIFY